VFAVLRLADTSFASGCHPIDGAGLLRAQLPSAAMTTSDGTVTITGLVVELATIAGIRRADGRLPFEPRRTESPFRSVSEDVEGAVERLGPRLREIVGERLPAGVDPHWRVRDRGEPPWSQVLEEAEAVAERLAASDALVAALEDALDAAAEDDARTAFTSLAMRLNEFRAVATYQGRAWRDLRHVISNQLTIRNVDDDGHLLGGTLEAGAPLAEVRERLHAALRRPVERRDFAVWIATLAGPSGGHDVFGSPIVNGPIAVSQLVCVDDVAQWIDRVRAELTDAFAQVGEVPADVHAFGEPIRYRGEIVETGEQLWADMATPPSFIARVAVQAPNREEAIREAVGALRAVYELISPDLAQSLRSDVVVWTITGGWSKPATSARGRSLGELLAARSAADAVSAWAGDLGSPLNAERLDLLRDRALAANRSAPVEIRVMRGFASLEALTPAGSDLDGLVSRLSSRTAYLEARSLLLHVLSLTSRQTLLLPADGKTWEDTRAGARALKDQLSQADAPGVEMALLDLIEEALEAVHPDALLPQFAQTVKMNLRDPAMLQDAKERHASAFRRARRHRNLIVHGHRVPELVLTPTAEFLARQLHVAIDAHHDDLAGASLRWLGSLSSAPKEDTANTSLGELIDAVANSQIV
jgi:hypothetical protein